MEDIVLSIVTIVDESLEFTVPNLNFTSFNYFSSNLCYFITILLCFYERKLFRFHSRMKLHSIFLSAFGLFHLTYLQNSSGLSQW